jgi:hypothetical protein
MKVSDTETNVSFVCGCHKVIKSFLLALFLAIFLQKHRNMLKMSSKY